MPSSALAIASSRRATRASASAFASLLSTNRDRTLRIDSAVILPSSNQSEGNHELDPLGIAPMQQESGLPITGITVAGDSPQFSALNAHFAPTQLVGSALTIVSSI